LLARIERTKPSPRSESVEMCWKSPPKPVLGENRKPHHGGHVAHDVQTLPPAPREVKSPRVRLRSNLGWLRRRSRRLSPRVLVETELRCWQQPKRRSPLRQVASTEAGPSEGSPT